MPRFNNQLLPKLTVLLVFSPAIVTTAQAQDSLPGTPAGQLLGQLIEAINDDDESTRMEFWKDGFATNDKEAVEQRKKRTEQVRARLGKITFKEIVDSAELKIAAACKTTAGPDVVFAITVSEKPHKISTIALELVRENPRMEADPRYGIDGELRKQLLEQLILDLRTKYVLPQMGEKLAAGVEESISNGDFDEIDDVRLLSSRLTRQLREISADKDLFLDAGPSSKKVEQQLAGRAFDNHGFVKVERLPGRIGYLKLTHFSGKDEARDVVSAAMTLLKGSEALIFDLRQNSGGDTDMIAYLSSYLFDKAVHLNSSYDREADTTDESWTLDDVPGPRATTGIPIYLLTGKSTFGGAEEFAYNLQSLKRAVVVGEPTAGNAHYTKSIIIGDRIQIFMPYAKAINPVTKTNWEGTGVKPDVAVDANHALDKARELISGKPTKTIANDSRKPTKVPPKSNGDLESLIEKAEGLMEQESFREAAIVFGEMTQKFPSSPAAWFHYGYCLHMSGDLDRAIKAHQKAAEFEQFATRATYNLACAYALKGQADEAFEALQKSILLGFDDAAALSADTDWNKLRDDRRYERLLENMKSDQ